MDEKPKMRYERCAICRREWNVSVSRKVSGGWYICPECEKRRRKR